MADNYLEKHYEDYLKRKAEWKKVFIGNESQKNLHLPSLRMNPCEPVSDYFFTF